MEQQQEEVTYFGSASICGHRMDTEFGFYLPSHDDVSPTMQTNFVKILGKSGYLNLSKQNGQVFYDSIERTWRFEKVTRSTDNADVDVSKRLLRNTLLGETGHIILDDDQEYYYEAFITAIDVSCENNGRIVAIIKAMTDPYKYKVALTEYSATLSSSSMIWPVNLNNSGKMPVLVTFTCAGAAHVSYSIGGVAYAHDFAAGTHIVNNVALLPTGTTRFVVGPVDDSIPGAVSFSFREGFL